MQTSYTFANQQDQILNLAERITQADWVALDTEFMRERTYYPVLCLLQIATPRWCDVVDPLADIDLEPLWLALYRTSLCKVFHAADQDLELLTQLRGAPPANLFDSQIAAPLLGHDESLGYARLVEAVTGVVLKKDQTRADWSQRPLSDNALRYAADDVIYLAAVFPKLAEELAHLGRTEWLTKDLKSLEEPARFRRDPERAGERLKGLDRLSPAQQARAQSLAAWRERKAQLSDQPKGWLISDAALQTLARRFPKSSADLKRVRDVKPAVVKAHGAEILDVLASAPETPQLPIKKARKRSNKPAQRALVESLGVCVSLIADRERIHPSALASQSDLEKWLQSPANAFSPAWRDQLLFQPLSAFLNGDTQLRVVGNRIAMVESKDS